MKQTYYVDAMSAVPLCVWDEIWQIFLLARLGHMTSEPLQ